MSALSDPLLRWSDSHSSPLFPFLPTWQSPVPPTSHLPTPVKIESDGTEQVPPLQEALHPLGPAADASYTLGPTNLADLANTLLDFVRVAFPPGVDEEYERRYGSLDPKVARSSEHAGSWDENKAIWQTDKDAARADSREVGTWKGNQEGWQWELVDDAYVF